MCHPVQSSKGPAWKTLRTLKTRSLHCSQNKQNKQTNKKRPRTKPQCHVLGLYWTNKSTSNSCYLPGQFNLSERLLLMLRKTKPSMQRLLLLMCQFSFPFLTRSPRIKAAKKLKKTTIMSREMKLKNAIQYMIY